MAGSTRDLVRALPFAGAHALVMFTLYVLKPVRNSLFLDRIGVGQLPVVLCAVAIAGAAAAGLYARFARTVRTGRLVSAGFVVLLGLLVVFRFVLGAGGSVVVWLFYVWVGLYGVLATSLVWLLAASAFDAREARRSFGFVGAGGIVGATAGGFFTKWAAHAVGTVDLLIVCAAVLAVLLVVIRFVRIPEAKRGRARASAARGEPPEIRRSELLRLLAAMAGIAAIVATVTDIQFNEIVDRSFATRDAKTAFFGEFFAWLNAFCFAFQVLLTPRILASRGVGAALLFLPAVLAVGSAGVLIAPALWSAILVKAGDGGFRHSIHKSATEILMIPVPADVRSRAKLFLDATVDTLGTGAGALAVLALTGPIGLPYPALSVLSLALIAVWLLLIRRVRRAYVGAFRSALERREIDLGAIGATAFEASSLESLRAALAGTNERQIAYALDLLSSVPGAAPAASVHPLLRHASAEIRRKALHAIREHHDPELASEVEALLADPDPGVRLEAIRFLCPQGRGAARWLEHPDPGIRAAALAYVATEGAPDERALVVPELVDDLLARGGEDARIQVARATGRLPALRAYLEPLGTDRSPAVVGHAIESAGWLRDPALLPWLLERLGEARHRKAARMALAAHGTALVPIVEEKLGDPALPRAARAQLPRVLCEIPVQASVDALVGRLSRVEAWLERALVKALSKLRSRHPELSFDTPRVRAALREGLDSYGDYRRVLAVLEAGPASPAARLVKRAVAEKRAALLERTFRLLGLLHPPKDMADAYHGIVSRDRALRASALEFLDNVLARDLKEVLLPLLEEDAPTDGRSTAPHRIEDVLALLVTGPDAWLRACAAFGARGKNEILAIARGDRDPMVREAAAAAATLVE